MAGICFPAFFRIPWNTKKSRPGHDMYNLSQGIAPGQVNSCLLYFRKGRKRMNINEVLTLILTIFTILTYIEEHKK